MPENPTALPVLVARAYRIVREAHVPSISLLQRRLRIGHKEAWIVMSELAVQEIVRFAPDKGFLLDPHHSNRHLQKSMLDTRSLYADKVLATVLFFLECHEEGSDGDTRAIEVLKPALVGNLQIREQVLQISYRTKDLSLTQAALDLHDWLNERGLVPTGCEGITPAIRTACLPHDRPKRKVVDEMRMKQRAFRRLARYYWLIHKYQIAVSNHSRVPDYFISAPWIHVGESVAHANARSAGTHPEHVVPCTFILRTCVELYSQEWSVEEVSWMLQRLLAIVDVTPEERDRLDKGEGNLKSSMPQGWDVLNGCIFARLHQKEIHIKALCACQPEVSNSSNPVE